MMYLKMILNDVLIDRVPITYEGLLSCEEKQQYQEKIAGLMYRRHYNKIYKSGKNPQFFIDEVESKMNQEKFLTLQLAKH